MEAEFSRLLFRGSSPHINISEIENVCVMPNSKWKVGKRKVHDVKKINISIFFSKCRCPGKSEKKMLPTHCEIENDSN